MSRQVRKRGEPGRKERSGRKVEMFRRVVKW
jgi:hypothetical protein